LPIGQCVRGWKHERTRRLPQITIGKLSGLARGGGSECLMALDMRFAAEETAGLAQKGLTGIISGAGATAYLPHIVGRPRALEIILGADLFDANTAERCGWINRAMPRAEFDGFVAALSRRIAGLAPGVLERSEDCNRRCAALAVARSTAHRERATRNHIREACRDAEDAGSASQGRANARR
jgi:enoyl-CoA hydratase/carnithine racemase